MDSTGNREQILLTALGAALAKKKALETIGKEVRDVPSRLLIKSAEEFEDARQKLNEYAAEQQKPAGRRRGGERYAHKRN